MCRGNVFLPYKCPHSRPFADYLALSHNIYVMLLLMLNSAEPTLDIIFFPSCPKASAGFPNLSNKHAEDTRKAGKRCIQNAESNSLTHHIFFKMLLIEHRAALSRKQRPPQRKCAVPSRVRKERESDRELFWAFFFQILLHFFFP